MPFPSNYEALLAAGYKQLSMDVCKECGGSMEVFKTPGGRQITCNPMSLLTTPAVEHFRTCNPESPEIRQALESNGWVFGSRTECQKCKKAVEVWTSPKGEPHTFQPMMEALWPVREHGPYCKSGAILHRNVQPATQTEGTLLPPEPQQERGGASAGQESGFKMYGVNDPNGQLVAVGWLDGVLRCQFKTALWAHEGVPEEKYQSLRHVPYAYSLFTKSIKSKFPAKKVA